MPVTKSAALRHRIIDTRIKNKMKKMPSVEDLREAVSDALEKDISISSINKDLRDMKDYYNAPIKYNTAKKGYYYKDEHFTINGMPLTSEEISALDMSISFLKQIKHSGFFTQFESAIEKIISGFRISKMPGYEKRLFLETEEPTADTGIRWLECMYEAILLKKTKEITYRKFNTTENKKHVMSPYIIREYRNRWYVVGYSELAEDVLILALDRVVEVKDCKNKFHRSDFDEHSYFKYSFGVTTYNGIQPSKVQLLFDEDQRGYISSKPLHASQKITDADGGFIAELECFLTPELEMTILSYGEKIKVIEPKELTEKIQKRVEAMGVRYKL